MAGQAAAPRPPSLSPEVQAKVRELGALLARQPDVARLLQAQATVRQREAARIMLRDLRRRQRALAEKQMGGQTPSEEEIAAFRHVLEVAGYNPYLRELLDAEVSFSALMGHVNVLLAEAMGIEPVEPSEPLEPSDSEASEGHADSPGAAARE